MPGVNVSSGVVEERLTSAEAGGTMGSPARSGLSSHTGSGLRGFPSDSISLRYPTHTSTITPLILSLNDFLPPPTP